MKMSKYIDHTLLKADAVKEQIEQLYESIHAGLRRLKNASNAVM